jgi:hypothetical protein
MDDRNKSLLSCSKRPALPLSGCQVAGRGAAFDWLSSQAARAPLPTAQGQPFGPGLFARNAASSLSYVLNAPSFFLALRANSSRRGVLGT